jgi:hypothetical protein
MVAVRAGTPLGSSRRPRILLLQPRRGTCIKRPLIAARNPAGTWTSLRCVTWKRPIATRSLRPLLNPRVPLRV